MTPPRFVSFLVLASCLSACASRAPTIPPRNLVAESAADLRAGCYRCFEAGLRLVDGRPDPASRRRAFEFLVLLAARAKELGLPFEAWRTRAADVAVGLPVTAAAPAFLSVVDALPVDPAGHDRNVAFGRRRTEAAAMREWLAAIDASGASRETSIYVQLAGACATFLPDEQEAARTRARASSGTPLIDYALGRCTADSRALASVLEAEPRLVDAAYPLARTLFRPPPGDRPRLDAATLLGRAHDAFPESAAIVFTHASLLRERGEWGAALASFDDVVKMVPAHHDARLGRVIALSNLARHDEAIAGATSLIDEGMWLVGDAYYWRAWNALNLGRLDASERDVERAKGMMRGSAVLVLSGLVRWRKQQSAVAEGEFVQALTLAPDDCDAATYLGGVRSGLRRWLPAATAFAGAEACRLREALALRNTYEELVARGAPAAALAAQEKRIGENEQQAALLARSRDVMMSNALAPYRLRPTASCQLPSESPQP